MLVIDGGDRRARILGRGTNRVQGRKRVFFIMVILISAVFLLTCLPGPAEAQPISIPSLTLEVDSADNPEELTQSLQILLLITLLSLAPALLIMVTCFTRIIVVFSFLRNALATQPMPPNQVLIGLALFLTFFIMAPTWQEINQNALQPYIRGEIAPLSGEWSLYEILCLNRQEKMIWRSLCHLLIYRNLKLMMTYQTMF